jgi:hypothetical protein
MAIDLQQKLEELRREGTQSVALGEGYSVHHGQNRRCSITYAKATTIDRHGLLDRFDPCIRVELRFVSGENVGDANKDGLLQAIIDGRINDENAQPLIEAVQQGRVLWLAKAKGLLVMMRKENVLHESVDHQRFFPGMEREQAIADIADHIRKYTSSIWGFSRLDAKDLLAVAAFVALQFPDSALQ